MRQIVNLRQLNNASFFDKNTLQKVVLVSDNSLYADIKRWIKNEEMVQLKRGLYVTNYYYQSVSDKDAYKEFVANNLKYPSYLSLEYVLQKYGVLSESVFAITSVSLKKTEIFQNKLGTFTYSNIKEGLFTGYKITGKGGFEIKEASRVKALFDYLYLRLLKIEITREVLESLRLNLNEFEVCDWREFSGYIKLSNIEKLKNLERALKEI